MIEKFDSTDFWYTFLNSLRNFGFSAGTGELELDEEMQENLLTYLKEKIEVGVTDGQTALPPGLHDYFWRFQKEMLPKLRVLAESFLKTDPNNGAAAIILAIVACAEGDSQYLSHIENGMRLVPEDPGMNLLVIDRYRCCYVIYESDIDWQERVLTSLENLYTWAKQEGATVRYQDAKIAYEGLKTPYAVYAKLKEIIKELKVDAENPTLFKMCQRKIEKSNVLVKKCIDLLIEEQAAFQKELHQESESQLKTDDLSHENPNFWDTFLDSLENHGLSDRRWRLTQKIQEQLLKYFKMKLEDGVIDGRTTLPSELAEYVPRLPQAMLLELQEFTEDVYEKMPNNGAAAKVLSIIVGDSDVPYLEQAMELLSNDAEVCYHTISLYAKSLYNRDDPLYEKTLLALEELYRRAQHPDESDLHHWLTRLYNELGRTPCHIYRYLMKNPDGNSELIGKCKTLIVQMLQVFQERLTHEPDEWYALRGLGDIYETLGETELAQKYPWEPHSEYRWAQTAWVGRQLPDFTAVTLEGKPISFSDYQGKMVLLNFCSKWCRFCTPEIPYVKKVYETHHKTGFEVIGVSLDENEAELREYIEEHEIPWSHIFDGEVWKTKVAKYFGINSVPSQWLIDREGKIISVDNRQDRLGQIVSWTETSRVGSMVPDFSAVDVYGEHVCPETQRGNVVLLYFCSSGELQSNIYTIYDKYHTRGFDIISICIYGGSNDELRDRIHEENCKGQHILDGDDYNGPLFKLFGINPWQKVPAFVLIDKQGKIVMSRYGKVHSPEEWAAKLDEQVATHLGLS